ncbi:MAG TPA: glycosyltransferase [Thermoanaerobaculia bacterium]|nr:glycosyltransferase [Thermoanaerobaculia bacterium]
MNEDRGQRSGEQKQALSDDGRKTRSVSGRVSIVILNFNGGDHTSACLRSLWKLTYPPGSVEIIVVDNASSDGSAEAISEGFPGVNLVRSPENVGFSRGANLGAEHATGEFLAFLNNDMKVDPSWLDPLVAAMRDPQVACAGSIIRNWKGSLVDFSGRRGDAFSLAYSASTDAPPEERVEGGAHLFVSGGAMLVRAAVFRKLGGFEQAYFIYQEDVDLCWRIWLSGHSCLLVPESNVFHRGGASSSRLPPELIQGMSQANALATLYKNLDDAGARVLLPVMVLYLLMRSGDQASGAEGFEQAIERFTDAIPELVRSRAAIQASRTRSDSELWGLVGHPLAFLYADEVVQKLSTEMVRGEPLEFSLTDAQELRSLIGHWVGRAKELIGSNESLYALERDRQARMRRLEVSARDAVIRERTEGIAFLKEALAARDAKISHLEKQAGYISTAGSASLEQDETPESRSAEISVLQNQVELLSRRTKEYESYVKFGELVAEVAHDLGVGNLRYDPRTREAPRVSTNQTLVTLEPPGDKYDIICFSIIDWEFRWQRPQQLMSQFAAHGHRVFYISIARMLPIEGDRCHARPLRENVWEVQLALPERVDVYGGGLSRDLAMLIVEDLRALCNTFRITTAVSIVQVATWAAAAYRARDEFGWPVVYDCMDEWDTFPGMSEALLTSERRLVREADLVVVTAARLFEKYESATRNLVLARNAADFERFHRAKPGNLLDDIPHPIVGYFGAIADWFDLELMIGLARERPKYSFVLIGGVFGLDMRDLEYLGNVHLLGQQPYEQMPSYLSSFDACIIPFKVNAITEATDPVKFYEFISQGKPVVSTTMPELYSYADLLYIASSQEDFLGKLDLALRENDPSLKARRLEVARANTWSARYETITRAISGVVPRVSIVVVTFDNLAFTRQCLESVFSNTLHPNFEVIVVDNASSDGTREYLSRVETEHQNVRIILNDTNTGFAHANNQGLRAASGDFLVLLNNDTVVPRGWLSGLLRHLRDPEVGLVNSVTNFSGNESRIDVSYSDMAGMEEFAARYTAEHFGEMFDIRVAAMYCVAMRCDVFESVGSLDETFGIGMFEDDDYSHRMRLAGYRVVCAEDSFVHHFGQASFKKLHAEEYQKIWDANQTHFQKKWNMQWQAHTPRVRASAVRSQLPNRAAIELLFINMARSRELRDVKAARAAEVLDLEAHVAAEKAHVQDLKYLLQLEQQKVDGIYQSRLFRLAQIYWKIVRFLRGRRPDGSPALTPDAFAPETAVSSGPPSSIPEGRQSEEPSETKSMHHGAGTALNTPSVPLNDAAAGKPDVICFSVVEWHFRMQRPQQMMLRFAGRGHRVFYVSHEIRLTGEPYKIRPVAENVFEVTLRGTPRDVYVQSMTQKDAVLLAEGMKALRRDYGVAVASSIVQLPFWAPLAYELREEFSWPVVYDLMDNLAAFSTSPSSILEVEQKLMTSADLVVATSVSLEQKAQSNNSNVVLVRNGCDYEHFASISSASPFHTKKGRPLIGYYGAIADWFDTDLVGELARRNPEWDFVLIGSTVSSNVHRLRRLRNISLAGERPYSELPGWLERFDVAIIPFRLTPLTEATNPVKAYEIMAGGKPMVSVPMPEVAAMAPLVRLASTVDEFEAQIRQSIEFDYEPWIVEKRKAYARQNSWESRVDVLEPRIRETFGRALIILDVQGKGSNPESALEALIAGTFWPNLEIVLTGADPAEGAGGRFEGIATAISNLRISSESSGTFAQNANGILTESDAEYIVILSTEVEVQSRWLSNMIPHLNRDATVGIVVPEVTGQRPGADAQAARLAQKPGIAEEIAVLPSVFAFRRELLDQIGLLDEGVTSPAAAAADFARRARRENLSVLKVPDALVVDVARAPDDDSFDHGSLASPGSRGASVYDE